VRKNFPHLLEKMKFPDPVISMAIEPKTKPTAKSYLGLSSLQKKTQHSESFNEETDKLSIRAWENST
jgi:translation elongation factor EF-G